MSNDAELLTDQPLAELLADQLLAEFDTIRPILNRSTLNYDVIVELWRRVEKHKFHDPVRALEIADTAVFAATAFSTTVLGDSPAEALAAWAKATALLFNGQATAALPFYRHAESQYGILALPIEQVSVQAPLVYALNAAGEQTIALELAMQVQAHCLALGEPARQALAHLEMNIGTIRKQQGAFAESLAACDRSKALFLALADIESAARAEMNRANVLQEMDRFAEAATAYAAARAPLLASQRNRQQVALIDFNLGLLAERRGRFLQALRYLEEAHDGFAPAVHSAAADLNRALIYNRLNLPTEALHLAHAAQTIFAANNMAMEEGHTLVVAGVAERQLGHGEKSLLHLQRAITCFAEQQADFWQATAQLALAETCLHTPKVLDLQQNILTRRDDPADQQAVSNAQPDLTPLGLSHQLAIAVKTEADRAEWPTLGVEARLLLVRHALLTESASSTRGEQWLHESIEQANHYHLTLHTLESHALLGHYYQQHGDHVHAWAAYQQAIARLEEIRSTLQIDELQLGYLADKAPIYTDAVALLYHAATTEQERANLLYLLNLAAVAPLPLDATDRGSHLGTLDDANTQALKDDLRQLQEARQWQQSKVTDPDASLAQTRATLDQLEHEIADCWRRIRVRHQVHVEGAASEQLAGEKRGIGERGVEDRETEDSISIDVAANAFCTTLQSQLAADEALILYAEINTQLVALVIRREASVLIPLGEFSAVEKTLSAWRFHVNDHALIQQNSGLAQPMARRILTALHRTLIAPLATHLVGCTHLYLTLPPALHDLPVAAFWDDGYLLERYQLTYLSAPAALLSTRARPGSACDHHALVVGHSHAGHLPQAIAEAEVVAATVAHHGPCDLLCEDAATADALLNASIDATLIHIAAHAHFAPTGPLFSAIHLADRELTLLELYHGAQLRCQPLVVLSACVTGQGIVRGGGLLGLARALFAAGAGELIVTTWRVDDESTATLMHHFYHTLTTPQSKQVGKQVGKQEDWSQASAALRTAQLAAAATMHPFHWAGLIFVKG